MMRLDFRLQFSRIVDLRQDTIPTAARSLSDAVQAWPALHWISESRRRRHFRQALAGTYGAYAARCPQWTAALFNEHFLTNQAYSFLDAYGRGEVEHDPVALAQLLGEQMWFRAETRQKRVLAMRPAAACFLHLLDDELGRGPQRSL